MHRQSVCMFTLAFGVSMVLCDSPSYAQFGQQPGRGSGIRGISGGSIRGGSGGISGIRGGRSISGGISGIRGGSGRSISGGISGISGGISGISGRRPGSMFEYVWTCSKCGAKVGRSNSMIDAPSSCPSCGVRFINGGIGSKRPGSSFRPESGNNNRNNNRNNMDPAQGWNSRRNNQPRNPVRQPARNNVNEQEVAAGRQPNSRPIIPQNPLLSSGESTPTNSSSSDSQEKSNALPLILIGVSLLAVLGSVAFLLISMNKKKRPAGGRSRPARRRQSMDRYLSRSRD